jgi:hypothetical protein
MLVVGGIGFFITWAVLPRLVVGIKPAAVLIASLIAAFLLISVAARHT